MHLQDRKSSLESTKVKKDYKISRINKNNRFTSFKNHLFLPLMLAITPPSIN